MTNERRYILGKDFNFEAIKEEVETIRHKYPVLDDFERHKKIRELWNKIYAAQMQPGEVFLTNMKKGIPISSRFKTKRPGTVAFTLSGEIMHDCIPWFVQKEEFEKGDR